MLAFFIDRNKNIINEELLGFIEYACKVAWSKVVVVMGHTKYCDVTAASKNFEIKNKEKILS